MTEPARAVVLGWQNTIDHAGRSQQQALAGAPASGGPGREPPLPRWNGEAPTQADQDMRTTMLAAATAYFHSFKGWDHAAALLLHYLDNTGTDFTVDPTELMNDVPSFKRDVESFVDSKRGTGSFDSGWVNTNTDVTDAQGNVTGQQSLDWYYALHDWRYRVTGTSTVEDGHTHTEYHVEIYKPYVFGAPRSDITVPVLGGTIKQDDIQHLNAVGLARNFIVRGDGNYSR